MNAAARLVMRRKDIGGGIIVQPGAVMPVKLREMRDFNFSTLLAGEEFFELGFGEDCHA